MELHKIKLKDICLDMHQGINTVADKVEYLNSGIPIIQSKNITSGILDLQDVRYLDKNTYENYKDKYNPQKGDILLCNIGTIGTSYVMKKNEQFLIAWNLFILKIDKNKYNPEYIKYYLDKLKLIGYFNTLLTGGTVKFINKTKMGDIEVPICSINEQDKVVVILDKAQSLINKRKEQIEALDELVKSRFIEMFGDPVKNPKGWEKDTIGGVTKNIITGWSVNGESRARKEDEIAVLKVSAVTKGFFKEDEYKVIDKDIEIKKYVFPQKGDLLFSRANTREMVGATCIIKNDYPNLLLPDKLWKVLFTEKVNVFYMKYVLSEQSIRKQFSAKSTGTSGSMYNVSMDKFKEIQITIPPIELQNEFADFVTQVDKLKADIEKSLKEMEDNFNSLMQKAFKGELF